MAATPDTEGILSVRSQSFPEVQVSRACIDHAVRAFHFILMLVEARGVGFRRARSKYDMAYFEKAGTRLTLSITEAVVTTKREPSAEEKRRPSWEWMLHSRGPCGRLTFRIDTGEGYSRHRSRHNVWEESTSLTLAETAEAVANGIWEHYCAVDKKREEEARESERRAEQRRKDEIASATRAHQDSVRRAATRRLKDLVRASEWWRVERSLLEFVEECERRWRSAGAEPTDQQKTWIAWARQAAAEMSPFRDGYPDPLRDGAFDPAEIPPGGPYPLSRRFPRPPTFRGSSKKTQAVPSGPTYSSWRP
jgi:hypothetical protein